MASCSISYDIKLMKKEDRWTWILGQWLKSLQLGLCIIILLMGSRVAMFFLFNPQKIERLRDLSLFLLRSIQFDLRIASIGIMPLILLTLFLSGHIRSRQLLDKVQLYYGSIFLILTLLLSIGNIGFFAEYHDNFNHWLFGLIYDDRLAIFLTIWHTYPIVILSLIIILASFLIVYGLKKLFKNTVLIVSNWPKKLFITILLIGILVVGIRGSIGRRPLQRKDISITRVAFLNKIIPNAYYAIYFSLKDYKQQLGAQGIEKYLKEESLTETLKLLLPEKEIKTDRPLDELLIQKPQFQQKKIKPKHVFLIVMESQDSWPMVEKYESLGLMRRLTALAKEGVWVQSFISSGSGTMPSLAAIISGMPEVGVYTHTQRSSRKPYATAIASQFKARGYQTNLFYGGYLSWQRLGDFAKDQGFENVYGGNDMGTWTGNEWGVHDKQLFEYVVSHLDPQKPSFNLIMTTSNHPRYIVDLKAENCPICGIPDDLQKFYDGSVDLNVLGHFWYADHCMGNFVEKAQEKLPLTLFAITGDHWSRHFLNNSPSLYERKSVPLVIYGPEITNNIEVPNEIAGSHLDIGPTLLELASENEEVYYSLGRNLFDKNKKQIGVGVDTIITPDFIFEIQNSHIIESLPWRKNLVQYENDNNKLLSIHYNAVHALGWWRIMKGNQF